MGHSAEKKGKTGQVAACEAGVRSVEALAEEGAGSREVS